MLTAVGWTYTVAFNGKTTAINLNTATNTTHQFEACEKTIRAFHVYETIDYYYGSVTEQSSDPQKLSRTGMLTQSKSSKVKDFS